MVAPHSSHNDGWLPENSDLGQIFIARQEQLDLFSFYLDRWLGEMPVFPDNPTMTVPSPNERIQGLLVLLYGRGGFGKSTLLKHYHDMVRTHHQKFLDIKIVDWEFAAEGKRHFFQGASGQEVDATEYFLLLCDRLAHALAKQINEFKEYQKAVNVIKEARKQMDNELRRLKEDDRYAWMRKLAGNGLVIALRQFVVPLRPFSPANPHDAPFAQPLLAWARQLYHIHPRVIRLDAAYWGLRLIAWIHSVLGAVAVVAFNPKNLKNRSCLPPTWTREELGKRSAIERFFGRVFLFFHLQRPPLCGWSEIAS
ncbi:MAG TPA: hypothetical protein VGL94_07150, partial [Ktedonobacteraceae bacterium]